MTTNIIAHDDLERKAETLAAQFGMTIQEMNRMLMYDLCHGLPEDVVDHALALFHATERILERGA